MPRAWSVMKKIMNYASCTVHAHDKEDLYLMLGPNLVPKRRLGTTKLKFKNNYNTTLKYL